MSNSDVFDFLDVEPDDNRCALCSKKRLVVRVTLSGQVYGFCAAHEHRGMLMQRGQQRHWPALRIVGMTGTYALDSDWEAYLLTALCGTDDRVIELLDALDALDERMKAS